MSFSCLCSPWLSLQTTWIQFETSTTAIKICDVQPFDTVHKLCFCDLQHTCKLQSHTHLFVDKNHTDATFQDCYGVLSSTIHLNLLEHIQLLLKTTLIQFVTYDKSCQFAMTVLTKYPACNLKVMVSEFCATDYTHSLMCSTCYNAISLKNKSSISLHRSSGSTT